MRFDDLAGFEHSGFGPRVVIVGSGPAGLTLALRLAELKVPSLLVEAGGWDYRAASQDFYRGRVVGDSYYALDQARLRQFGGTSAHWTGWCRPLDAVDFEPRPGIEASGWPIGKADLDPYAAHARRLLQIDELPPDRPLTADLDEISIAFSPPVRFGSAWRDAVERSDTIGLLLDSTVRELVPGRGRIDALQLVDAEGRKHRLPAPQVCLCTGGIENSRLLLWSNRRHGDGVVPQPRTLGRYWMEHPVHTTGDALLFDGAAQRLRPRGFFAPSAALRRAQAGGGAHAWLRERGRAGGARELLKSALCTAPQLFAPLVEAAGGTLRCGSLVRLEWEQLPQADNRVALGRDVDAHGVPRVELHWRKSEAERRSALLATRALGEALIRHELGRLRMRRWLLDDGDDIPPPEDGRFAGFHHMGGTRMADAPERGVVDRDCKVFGVDNLYVGGSSVFATGGHANPTFTIVQLALRLAEYLARRAAP